ncbi:SCO2400 family protein [Streptomyces sp. bgisy032]|uniref:SCO2400 family protein n=1 Tax=Streptomyces sp. bgisy032 TaxID=3413773 RepID=UPI003D728A0A
MDYCTSCRRHLNGALVCPGCGAYAPDIDPCAVDRPGPAPAPAMASGGAAAGEYAAGPGTGQGAGTWHDGTVWDDAPGAGTRTAHDAPQGHEPQPFDPSGGDDSPESGPRDGYRARPEGRAARRRQMARWKKNQRRAVVATAVALVGGGLTVTAMSGNAGPGVQAATTPGDRPMGGAGDQAHPDAEPATPRHDTPASSPTPTEPPQTARTSERQPSRDAEPRTTPVNTRTDAATASTPRELPLTTAPRRSAPDTAPAGDGASASKPTQQAAPPADTSGADAQQPADSATPPSETGSTPPATSPSDSTSKELCLLVICLGG